MKGRQTFAGSVNNREYVSLPLYFLFAKDLCAKMSLFSFFFIIFDPITPTHLFQTTQKLIVPFEMRGYQGVYNLERKVSRPDLHRSC